MNCTQPNPTQQTENKESTPITDQTPDSKVFVSKEKLEPLHQQTAKPASDAGENSDSDKVSFPHPSSPCADDPAEALFHTADALRDEEPPADSPHTLFDDIDSDEYTEDGEEARAHTVLKKKVRRWPWITAGCVLFVLLCYLLVAYIPSGPIANLRNVYIQTAMSTADHQWMATWLFSQNVIDRAWSDPNVKPPDAPENSEFLETAGTDTETTTDVTAPITDDTSVPVDTETETTEPAQPTESDILGLSSLKVGDTDYAGNKVIVADEEEGLFISEFTLTSTMLAPSKYHGYAMLIDDPSRVFIGSTPKPYVLGYRLGEMMDHYGNVIAGINASGFSDPNDAGTGGDIIGACFSEGKFWGRYTNSMASVVLTKDNQLVAGWLPDWSKYTNIRDGMQFGPVLVDKGKNLIDKASGGGWGIHPRSAIGQREDGAIIMIVIDGRVPSSIGCTLWEMADMMTKYGAVTAGGCDGGSSVVIGYGDEILNENSSANPTYGRKMPNAFLVRSKKKDN